MAKALTRELLTGGRSPAERADSTSTPLCRNAASSADCCVNPPCTLAAFFASFFCIAFAWYTAHFSRQTELAGSLIFAHLPYFFWTSRCGSKPKCNKMNAGPMSHHCSPQSLHRLRFFFFAFTSTTSNNSQGSKSPAACRWDFFPEYPEYLLSAFSAELPAGSPGSPESRSRV